jgi:hypothetical protein
MSSCATNSEQEIQYEKGLEIVRLYGIDEIQELEKRILDRGDSKNYPILSSLCYELIDDLDKGQEILEMKKRIRKILKNKDFLREVKFKEQEETMKYHTSFLQEEINDFQFIRRMNELLYSFYYHEKNFCGFETPRLELLSNDTLYLLPNKLYKFQIALFIENTYPVFRDYLDNNQEVIINTNKKHGNFYVDTINYIIKNPLTNEETLLTKPVFINLIK